MADATTLRYCPECDGLGSIDGNVCGVCCGDRLIWPDDGTKPDWLRGRFEDHSHYDHRCGTCSPAALDREGGQ